jgi:putative ABC transport system permease protein
MGVRKVLGASVTQVIGLFAREFTPLMILSSLIAWPLAWLLVSKWMDQYAYRVGMDVIPFFVVAICLTLLVGAVIFLRTWRMASESPAQKLRSE